jgi:hypothetical protein
MLQSRFVIQDILRSWSIWVAKSKSCQVLAIVDNDGNGSGSPFQANRCSTTNIPSVTTFVCITRDFQLVTALLCKYLHTQRQHNTL